MRALAKRSHTSHCCTSGFANGVQDTKGKHHPFHCAVHHLITVQSQLVRCTFKINSEKKKQKQRRHFVNKSSLTDKKNTQETTTGAHFGEHHSFTSHRAFKVAISLQ